MDLGLPSGTLWATCNVGASKDSDYGLYFQWGDTQGYTTDQVGTGSGKKAFTWADYKFSIGGSSSNFSKYTTTDATLELEDDAAHVNMGGDWHMPTDNQIIELINTANTTTAWTTSDGVNGMTFTSKKEPSKSIFIPASGEALDGYITDSGKEGFIWSSTLDGVEISKAMWLYVFFVGPFRSGVSRYYGLPIRGVIS